MFPAWWALCSFIIFFLACEMNCIKVSNFAKNKCNNEDFNIQTKKNKLRLNIYTQWKKNTPNFDERLASKGWCTFFSFYEINSMKMKRIDDVRTHRNLYTFFFVRIAIVTSHTCLLAFVCASPGNSLLLSTIIDI